MEIITRAQAKVLGQRRYFTGKSCKHGHVSQRAVSNGRCLECDRAYERDCYPAQREQRIADSRAYRVANLDKCRAYDRAHYARNAEARRTYDRAYRFANPEKTRAYTKAHRHEFNAREANRRAAKLKATPPWLTPDHKAQIAVLYKEAARLTRETGIEHHVDHIVPLKAKDRRTGKRVASGLHVPWNLRVVPGPENLSKNCYIELPQRNPTENAETGACPMDVGPTRRRALLRLVQPKQGLPPFTMMPGCV